MAQWPPRTTCGITANKRSKNGAAITQQQISVAIASKAFMALERVLTPTAVVVAVGTAARVNWVTTLGVQVVSTTTVFVAVAAG
jgi:hypothetical protein